MEFFFHDIDPLLRQVLTVIIIFIGEVNEVVLSKKNHSRCANIAFAGNNTDATFEAPAMGDLVDREEFVKVFFSDIV